MSGQIYVSDLVVKIGESIKRGDSVRRIKEIRVNRFCTTVIYMTNGKRESHSTLEEFRLWMTGGNNKPQRHHASGESGSGGNFGAER